jgi:adenylate kinase
VGDLVKEQKFYDGLDEELDSYYLDEDKLLDHMEVMLKECDEEGVGVICDYHCCELFPERWFDLVLVLRADTNTLFDRLTKRGYSEKKRAENMECEIMQIILEEAKESYAKEIVHEVPSNTIEEMEANIERVQKWVGQWIADQETKQDEELRTN